MAELSRFKKKLVEDAINRTHSKEPVILCESICEDLVCRYSSEKSLNIALRKMNVATTKDIRLMIECYFSECENKGKKRESKLPERNRTIWS